MPSRSSCKIDPVLDVVSDQWTLAIVHELTVGPRRTLELQTAFEGMSTKTLAARLKKLQRRGLVERRVYGESPPRVEYSLTAKGERLNLLLAAINEIAAEWNESVEGSFDRPPCQACEIKRGANGSGGLRKSKEVNITKPEESEPARDSEPRPPSLRDVTLL